MRPEPTIVHEQGREHYKARWWRKNVVRLTIAELADRTGYSVNSIYRFEKGCTSAGEPHAPQAWQRYRMVCAAVGKREEFQWDAR